MGLFKSSDSKIGLGIEIDGPVVRVAHTQVSGKKILVKSLDEIILNPNQDVFEQEELQSFFSNLNLTKKSVASNLENPALRIRRMELPPMPESDFIEAIRFNLRDQIEGDPSEYEIRYSVLGKSEGAVPKKEIVVFGIPHPVIEENVENFKNHNIKLEVLEPNAVSIAAWFDQVFPNDTETTAIVHFSYKHSFFVVVDNGTFLFSRPLLDLPLSVMSGEDASHAALQASLSIQKSIDSFCLIFKREKVNKIVVSGYAKEILELVKMIKQNLGLDIVTMDQNFPDLIKNDSTVNLDDMIRFTIPLALSIASI